VANLVIVKLGSGGKVTLFNSNGNTHVVADVAGWYDTGTSAAGARYNPVTPARILNTIAGTGAPAVPVGPGQSVELQVTGRGGVPSTGVSAVAMNVTVTQGTTGGFITVYPTGEPLPFASNLNHTPGATVPNLVIVKLGSGGKVTLYNSSGTSHLVADVAGWYTAA
jgi:hypothetical protein